MNFSKLQRVVVILAVLSSIFILTIFLLRASIANWALGKVKEKFRTDYHATLSFNNISVHGLSGISGKEFYIVQDNKDTLTKAEALSFELDLFHALTGDFRFKSFSIRDGYFHPVKKGKEDNYSFLLNKGTNHESSDTSKGYGYMLNRLLRSSFKALPPKLKISGFNCVFIKDQKEFVFIIKKFFLYDQNYRSSIEIPDTHQVVLSEGQINKRKRLISGNLYGEVSSMEVPFLNDLFQLDFRFDTLTFNLAENRFSDEKLNLKGKIKFDALKIKHPKLDSNELAFKKIAVNYFISLEKSSVTFESDSAYLNDICLNGKATIDRKNQGIYSLNLNMPEMEAQKFFSSLPVGLFSSLEGIKVEGKLSYQLNFYLDRSMIDSLKFSSNFSESGFKVISYGKTDFSKMNNPFVHTAFEKGVAVKSFTVGIDNSEFTPIDQISPYLKNAVLCSEDGSFYWHKGFREDAFVMAMKDNIRKGKFARGGSTISMQLVKNVFLTREKTIARKVEEALIVWIIENKRLTGKERMYEVYLNIIEWGPGIYGIGNASKFYFNKKPSDLTIEESIFLASIVPQPKAFKYYFDGGGKLKPFLNQYFKKIGTLLLRKEIITEEENNKIVPLVKLTGGAAQYVFQDSLAIDSSFFQQDETLPSYFIKE
ncbi:penicillin-binding protein [Sporocytophaga myxococcoides]|uniref:Penicillin-binding protein n=1 Tax=Sporocytophaga myxococcoides TaxID=153721 RepID=A0A098L8T8_9BACT|nr:biosynthetic peptidoglycan transglycosylase [Sporocytophaga myxococcoides]GAL83241.1 penicillin-binding protein [Sporocytophaga myxococcoides]